VAGLLLIEARHRNTAHRDDPRFDGSRGLLWHSGLKTTLLHYIKDVPEVTANGMARIEQLFSKLDEKAIQ
jgi:hypothetical protein